MIAMGTILSAGKKVLASPKMLVAILVSALIMGNVYLGMRLDSVKADKKLLQYRVDTTVSANEANQETIDKLKESNNELVEIMEISLARARAEAAAADVERASLVAERARIQRELRDSLSATPSCEDLANLDLSAMCPEFVERLLRFYERSRTD